MGNSIFHKTISLVFILSLVFIYTVELESAQKERLSKTNIKKIKKIADFISSELRAKEITALKFEGIKDSRGRRSTRAGLISTELRKQLENNGLLVREDAVVILKGVLMRFRDDPKKYNLKIEVYKEDGSIITSYTGVLKW